MLGSWLSGSGHFIPSAHIILIRRLIENFAFPYEINLLGAIQ
jgi:hypothetical protein